jgi:flagellar biosynthesis/type III secretory pathway protein FliH
MIDNNDNNEIPEDEDDELEKLFEKLNEEHKDKKPDRAQDILRLIRAQTKKNQRTLNSFNQDTGEENEHWKRSNNSQTTRLRQLLNNVACEQELENDPIYSAGFAAGKTEGFDDGYAEGKLATEEWCKLIVSNLVKLYSNNLNYDDID